MSYHSRDAGLILESVNRGDGWDTEFTPDLSALPLSRCSSITNVIFAPRDRLEVSPGIMDWDQQALTMIRRCIVELPSLRSLAIDISSIKQDVDRHGRSSPMTIPAVIPNHIDRATGVSCEGAIPLTWEAEKGQTLTWTDDGTNGLSLPLIYILTQSIPPLLTAIVFRVHPPVIREMVTFSTERRLSDLTGYFTWLCS
jgi:hypothetical protein